MLNPIRTKTARRALLASFAALGGMLAVNTFVAHAQSTSQDAPMSGFVASYIPMPAAQGQADAFAEYLSGAASIVRDTEPGTAHWFGLRADDTLAIFDVFVDEAARQAHFEGKVAADINANAATWVEGGWDGGVIPNVNNATVLSARDPIDLGSVTTATYIALKAKPGQEEALADLLTAGGKVIADTEPGTLFWVAIRIDEDDFAIFDAFADEAGRTAHFNGQVAALLNQNAAMLVEGGWDNGVVANVRNFDVLAVK